MLDDLREGLEAGAVGIGITLGYMPAISAAEVYEMQKTAGLFGRQACVHTRHTPGNTQDEIAGVQEILANAAALGAPACINHFNNAGWQMVQQLLLDMRAQGANVWSYLSLYCRRDLNQCGVFKPEVFEDKLGWSYEKLI